MGSKVIQTDLQEQMTKAAARASIAVNLLSIREAFRAIDLVKDAKGYLGNFEVGMSFMTILDNIKKYGL